MARLCGGPGCSEVAAAAYGMVPEDLLFWISPINEAPTVDPSLLCRRHADAMVVPRGWTLDDRREPTPRLFSTRALASAPVPPLAARRQRSQVADGPHPEQMQIDGTGEIGRPELPIALERIDPIALDPIDPIDSIDSIEAANLAASNVTSDGTSESPNGRAPEPWQPEFDVDDDLDGLLQVSSPLLARAFRGTDRPKH